MAQQIERSLPRCTEAGVAPIINQLTAMTILVAAVVAGVVALLVFGRLSEIERWFLIAFVAVFPVVGLAISWILISSYYRRAVFALSDKKFSWHLMSPEQQRNKLNLEVMMISTAMQMSETERGELLAAYVVAEDLALRRVELDNKLPLMRHVVLEGVPFEGVAIKDGLVYCVEMTFLVEPNLPPERLNAWFEKIENAARKLQKAQPEAKIKLLLAIVTQLSREDETRLKSNIKKHLAQSPVDLDLTFMDFADLQTTFTLE